MQKRTSAAIAKDNQETCAKWYANARKAMENGAMNEARMWQDSAATHFVKLAHRVGVLEDSRIGAKYLVSLNYYLQTNYVNGTYTVYLTFFDSPIQHKFVHTEYEEICRQVTKFHFA